MSEIAIGFAVLGAPGLPLRGSGDYRRPGLPMLPLFLPFLVVAVLQVPVFGPF